MRATSICEFILVHLLTFSHTSLSVSSVEFRSLKLDPPADKYIYTLHIRTLKTDFKSIAILDQLLQENIHQIIYTTNFGYTENVKPSLDFNEQITLNIIIETSNNKRIFEEYQYHDLFGASHYSYRDQRHAIFILIRQSCSTFVVPFAHIVQLQLFFHYVGCNDILHSAPIYRFPLIYVHIQGRGINIFLYYAEFDGPFYTFGVSNKKELRASSEMQLYHIEADFLCFPFCLKSYWKMSETNAMNGRCTYNLILLQNLQLALNFTVRFLDEPITIHLQFYVLVEGSAYESTNYFSNYLIHTDNEETYPFYCEHIDEHNVIASFSPLAQPFSREVWLTITVLLFVLSCVGIVMRKDQEVNLSLKIVLIGFFSSLFLMFRTFIRHEITHTNWIVSLLSFIGVLVSSLYENDITSRLIVPSPPFVYDNIIELLQNNFTILYPVFNMTGEQSATHNRLDLILHLLKYTFLNSEVSFSFNKSMFRPDDVKIPYIQKYHQLCVPGKAVAFLMVATKSKIDPNILLLNNLQKGILYKRVKQGAYSVRDFTYFVNPMALDMIWTMNKFIESGLVLKWKSLYHLLKILTVREKGFQVDESSFMKMQVDQGNFLQMEHISNTFFLFLISMSFCLLVFLGEVLVRREFICFRELRFS